MTWTDVLESPYLKDIPFKIELNEWGQIVMSPASNNHGYFQIKIGALLEKLKTDGDASGDCSIQTAKNVKVPDAVWMSSKFIADHSIANAINTPLTHAPELCIEIVSPSNSRNELKEKRELYFERGALEVWLCSSEGEMSFFDRTGELAQSKLFPNFPKKIRAPILNN